MEIKMIKRLSIDLYKEGYRIDQTDCWKLPVACAAGKYCYEYYFIYLFYTTLELNWNITLTEEEILNKLGLKLDKEKIVDVHEMIPFVKSKINEGIPVILEIHYDTLFFAFEQYKNFDQTHGLLVSGYDENRHILEVRDWVHMYNNSPELKGLFKLWLRNDIVEEMAWTSGKKINKDEYINIYTLQQMVKQVDTNYMTCLKKLIAVLEHNENKLVILLNEFNQFLYAQEIDIELIKRTYVRSVEIIFDIIVKNVNTSIDEITNLKTEYINFRIALINKLIKQYLKKVTLTQDTREKYMNQITRLDKQLLELLKKIVGLKEKMQSNCSEKAVFTADSEYRENSTICKAENLKNDRDENWKTDSWQSGNELVREHWVQASFDKKMDICKIIIKHDSYYPTVDFTIEGSNDQMKWIEINKVNNNSDIKTIHYLKESGFQYYRLSIQTPSKIDWRARIFAIQFYERLLD